MTVEDTKAPSLHNVPADITVECDSVPAPATGVTASDNCDTGPVVSFAQVETNGSCAGRYTLTRTWTATDSCGNSRSQSQLVTVIDTTDPVLHGVPTDVTVDCDSVPAPATPTASDNCDSNPSISFSETRIDGSCPNSYTLLRTWTATGKNGFAIHSICSARWPPSHLFFTPHHILLAKQMIAEIAAPKRKHSPSKTRRCQFSLAYPSPQRLNAILSLPRHQLQPLIIATIIRIFPLTRFEPTAIVHFNTPSFAHGRLQVCATPIATFFIHADCLIHSCTCFDSSQTLAVMSTRHLNSSKFKIPLPPSFRAIKGTYLPTKHQFNSHRQLGITALQRKTSSSR